MENTLNTLINFCNPQKLHVLLFSIFTVLVLSSCASPNMNKDFLTHTDLWGISSKVLKNNNAKKLYTYARSDNNCLVLLGYMKIDEIEFDVAYMFESSKLCEIEFINYSNILNSQLSDYELLDNYDSDICPIIVNKVKKTGIPHLSIV